MFLMNVYQCGTPIRFPPVLEELTSGSLPHFHFQLGSQMHYYVEEPARSSPNIYTGERAPDIFQSKSGAGYSFLRENALII